MEYLLEQGAIHDIGVQQLFGIVNYCQNNVVGCFIEEVLEVGIVDCLDLVLEELVDKKETNTQGEGRGGYVKTNI